MTLMISLLFTGCDRAGLETDSEPPGMPRWQADPARTVPARVRRDACMDAELADVDGDQDIDVVLAMEGPANVVLLNDGGGRLSVAETTFQEPTDSEHVQVADVNHDFWVDLFFANEDLGGANELYLGGPNGYLDASDELPGAQVSNAAVLRDLDRDGDVDLLLGNAGQNTWWARRDGAWEDLTSHLPEDFSTTQDLDVADLDGDGDLDVVLGNEQQDEVWLRDGDDFVRGAELPSGGGETREVGLADVDLDGDPDLVLARVGWTGRRPQSRLLMNDGSGGFTPAPDALPNDDLDTLDLDFVDLDDDGDPDLLGAHSSVDGGELQGEGYTVWENRDGRFVDVSAEVLVDSPRGIGLDIEAADLDGDGVLDLYLCGRGTADRVLFGTRV